MTTVTLELPEEVAKIAQERGLLSTAAIEAYVRGQVHEDAGDETYPPGFDMRLKGAAAPDLMGSVKYHGDIVGPFFEEWGEKP